MRNRTAPSIAPRTRPKDPFSGGVGATLLELAVVITILGVGLGFALPRLGRQADRAAAISARESVAALVDRARAAAVLEGRAELIVRADSSVVRVEAAGRVDRSVDLGQEYGVQISMSGGQSAVRLAFDRMGLGRAASRTFLIHRAADTFRLVVSSYGRVTRP